jgi:hypothetical protein
MLCPPFFRKTERVRQNSDGIATCCLLFNAVTQKAPVSKKMLEVCPDLTIASVMMVSKNIGGHHERIHYYRGFSKI